VKILSGWSANPLLVRERISIVRIALHDAALFSVSLAGLEISNSLRPHLPSFSLTCPPCVVHTSRDRNLINHRLAAPEFVLKAIPLGGIVDVYRQIGM
jgi:hypothetical protein